MSQKYVIILGALGFVAWFAWFYRYDASGGNGLVLDRWRGALITLSGSEAIDLSDVETMDQQLSRLLSRPETYLSNARRTGYSDGVILDALAKKVPKFDLDAARATGYDDTTILESLLEEVLDGKTGKVDAPAAGQQPQQRVR